jgi:hypothetical protein
MKELVEIVEIVCATILILGLYALIVLMFYFLSKD